MIDIFDKSNMLSVLKAFPEQIKEAYKLENAITLKGLPENIIICGMGGSSISGIILAEYIKSLGVKIPVFNIEDYSLPNYATKNSLIIIASYSGNTEEAVSCYKQGLKSGFNVIAIASGGKILELATNNRKPIIIIPKGYQPRNAVAFLFFPMLRILENSGIIPNQSDKVNDLSATLNRHMNVYEKTAQDLAQKIYGKIPIIYSSSDFYCVAYRWKSEFNENSKILSYCNVFPELNHNELMGYVNYSKMNIPLHIIMLRYDEDNKRIIKRMNITKKLVKELSNDKITFSDVLIKGDCWLTRLFTTICLGDLASYHLALLYSTDPTPVDVVERFKKEMGPII